MRVISGKLRNRLFKAPSGYRTHPMGERQRSAIFNMLGEIQGLTVLDAFSGSGALAFESASRGARDVIAIDSDKSAYTTLSTNIDSLGVEDRVKPIQANVLTWVKRNKNISFDVIFVDPPYDAVNYAGLKNIALSAKLGGIVVYSLPVGHDFTLDPQFFTQLEERQYAGAALVFFRRIG